MYQRGRFVAVSRNGDEDLLGRPDPQLEDTKKNLKDTRIACWIWVVVSLVIIGILSGFLIASGSHSASIEQQPSLKRSIPVQETNESEPTPVFATSRSPPEALRALSQRLSTLRLTAAHYVARRGSLGSSFHLGAATSKKSGPVHISVQLSETGRPSLPSKSAVHHAVERAARMWNSSRCAHGFLRMDRWPLASRTGMIRAATQGQPSLDETLRLPASYPDSLLLINGWVPPAFFDAAFGTRPSASDIIVAAVFEMRSSTGIRIYEMYMNSRLNWLAAPVSGSHPEEPIHKGTFDVQTVVSYAIGRALGQQQAQPGSARSPMASSYSGPVISLTLADHAALCRSLGDSSK